jgi:hypothetical protein
MNELTVLGWAGLFWVLVDLWLYLKCRPLRSDLILIGVVVIASSILVGLSVYLIGSGYLEEHNLVLAGTIIKIIGYLCLGMGGTLFLLSVPLGLFSYYHKRTDTEFREIIISTRPHRF